MNLHLNALYFEYTIRHSTDFVVIAILTLKKHTVYNTFKLLLFEETQ